jgi:hypothetical protein
LSHRIVLIFLKDDPWQSRVVLGADKSINAPTATSAGVHEDLVSITVHANPYCSVFSGTVDRRSRRHITRRATYPVARSAGGESLLRVRPLSRLRAGWLLVGPNDVFARVEF